jgi:hypothetical protein
MSRHLTPHWLWQSPFWHRRRSLQAPAAPGLGLAPALAWGSGSGIADRRELAVVKASERRTDERQEASERRGL